MSASRELARLLWRPLRRLLGLYICLHDHKILRRGPSDAMGLECLGCGSWWAFELPLSPLARRLARIERRLKRDRHARPLVAGSFQAIVAAGERPAGDTQQVSCSSTRTGETK